MSKHTMRWLIIENIVRNYPLSVITLSRMLCAKIGWSFEMKLKMQKENTVLNTNTNNGNIYSNIWTHLQIKGLYMLIWCSIYSTQGPKVIFQYVIHWIKYFLKHWYTYFYCSNQYKNFTYCLDLQLCTV